jgi:CRP-like cAMP-binding protein
MLITVHFHEDQYIFSEGDSINYMYFIEKGTAGFVLPRYQNACYIVIESGDYFGVIDLYPMREKQGRLEPVDQ